MTTTHESAPERDTPPSWRARRPCPSASQCREGHLHSLRRCEGGLEYTPLAAAFCREEFTVTDIRKVYEQVWGVRLDPRNFHRKVTGVTDLLEPTGHTSGGDGGRPAQVYRRGRATQLHPPMLRPAS
ncbi:NrtR DNA-binding winged helix domain-containing protein [Amycolatopsis sp. H20-H5]|uniref:NrtR DNA-binding winged helix domain-containing protein n=1 Tax=Amycolatopsis sp. H20-H5 TaxID=3046309 RepID=UPI003FA3C566